MMSFLQAALPGRQDQRNKRLNSLEHAVESAVSYKAGHLCEEMGVDAEGSVMGHDDPSARSFPKTRKATRRFVAGGVNSCSRCFTDSGGSLLGCDSLACPNLDQMRGAEASDPRDGPVQIGLF